MKRLPYLLMTMAVIAALTFTWNRQPWMRSGSAVHLGRWKFGEVSLEVWQRKNNSFLEAFATGLFVRHGTNHLWQVFCLDIQDTFKPDIQIRMNGALIELSQSGQQLGELEPMTGTFKYGADGAIVTPGIVGSEPPADWWIGR